MTVLLATLVLVVGAEPAPLPVDVMTESRLTLLPRADAARHLRLLDEELAALRVTMTPGQVVAQSVQNATPLVLVGLLPALGLGFLLTGFGTGTGGYVGSRYEPTLGLIIGLPIGVAVFATLVYCVGSLVDYFVIRGPERSARLTQLEVYRPKVEAAAAHNPP